MKARQLYILVGILFLLSGMASLMYQIVWFKELSYFMGSTTYAQSAVLAAFMGGLAIGAYWFGKKADTTRNPLRLFAFLELGIAAYCFLYSFAFDLGEGLLVTLATSMELSSDHGVVTLLKFLIGILILIIPTILMGGTLPLIVKHFSKTLSDLGKNISFFYFINSFGAMLGIILAGFYCIELFGLKATIYIGALIELGIGVITLLISRKNKAEIVAEEVKTTEGEMSSKQILSKGLLLLAFLSGFSAMIYEVLWVRALIPVLGSTTYSFSIMLASFVGGIALGSFILNRILDRIKEEVVFTGILQWILAGSVLFTIVLYSSLPYTFWSHQDVIETAPGAYSSFLRFEFIYIFLLLLIPTTIMGMTLPLINILYSSDAEHLGESTGNVFSINTLGTVVGSLSASLLFIPLFGIFESFFIAVGVNIIMGGLLIRQAKTKKGALVGAAIFILTLGSGAYFGAFNKATWISSVMMTDITRKVNRVKPPSSFQAFIGGDRTEEKVLFYEEGIGGTVVVGKKGNEIALFTNGKGDANSISDLPTQMSLAHVPLILHEKPEEVFVIGLGAGTTAGNVLMHDRVKTLTVAEISEGVVKASEYFKEINNDPLSDDRLTLVKDDGVTALRLSDQMFDVIISQPSNPWSAGVGNLFTTDFFKDVKSKLNKGGILAQWINLYEMDDPSMRLVLRTIQKEFPHISLWQVGSTDILMICSLDKIGYDLQSMRKNFDAVADKLTRIQIKNFETFASQNFANSLDPYQEYLSKEDVLNTQDHPRLEYMAPRALFYNATPVDFIKRDPRISESKNTQLLIDQCAKSGISDSVWLTVGLYQLYHGNKRYGELLGEQQPLIYVGLAEQAKNKGDLDKATDYVNKALSSNPKMIEAYHVKASILMDRNDTKAAIDVLNAAISGTAIVTDETYYERALMYEKLEQFDKAIDDYKMVLHINESNIKAYNNLATIYGRMNQPEAVLNLMNTAIRISPNTSELYFNRGAAKGVLKDYKGAGSDFSKVIELDPNNLQAYFMRGRSYQKMGMNEQAMNDFRYAAGMGHQASKQILQQLQ